MPLTAYQSIPASCEYCGRENPERLLGCGGCGTPFDVPQPQSDLGPNRKSPGLAVALTLLFGPIGLVYVGAWQAGAVIFLIALPFKMAHAGVWVTIGVRIVSVFWALSELKKQDEAPNVRRDSARLLDKAAQLENVDFSKAILAYEEIIQLYPDTSASKEAARSIRTLKQHIGSDVPPPSEKK
jgi:hypothetical protein